MIKKLLRKNIAELKPYSSARNEYNGQNAIFLDANENPFRSIYNRYPDPLQNALKEKIAKLKNINKKNIFLGNGSDEAIDLLIRAFCEVRQDNIISINPSYGMYQVCADINNVELKMVSLKKNFQLDINQMIKSVDKYTKLMIICSPNNPTANSFDKDDIIKILDKFEGLIIIDEAYIDFSEKESMINLIKQYENIVILQTFSKAWGMAGLRLGMAIANNQIIEILNNVKYPYNINSIVQKIAYKQIDEEHIKNEHVNRIKKQKEYIKTHIKRLDFVEKLYPSDANFFLVKVKNADELYYYLKERKIIIRNRSKQHLCENCVRITVGTEKENNILVNELYDYDIKRFTKFKQNTPEFETSKNHLHELYKFLELQNRVVKIERNTKETQINVELNIDGKGIAEINTGLGFFDHMLEQIARHSMCNLKINVVGDLHVDEHHTIEDTAIVIGEAFYKALGNKKGIERYGYCLPMDDSLAQVALDFGGRNWIEWNVDFKREKIGDMPTEMFFHFFKSFSDSAKCNLNIKAEGNNEHHKIEAIFKAFAKSIKKAVKKDLDNNELPSTKGIL